VGYVTDKDYLEKIHFMLDCIEKSEMPPITLKNTQFITRTNDVKFKIANEMLKRLLLKNEEPHPGVFYRGQTVSVSVAAGNMPKNTILEVVGHITVQFDAAIAFAENAYDPNDSFKHLAPTPDLANQERMQADEFIHIMNTDEAGYTPQQQIKISLDTPEIYNGLDIIDEKEHQHLYEVIESICDHGRSINNWTVRNGEYKPIYAPISDKVKESMLKHMRRKNTEGIKFRILSVDSNTRNLASGYKDVLSVLVLKNKRFESKGGGKPLPPTELYFVPMIRGYREHIRNACCVTVHGMQGNQAQYIVHVVPYKSKHETTEQFYTGATRAESGYFLFVPNDSAIAYMATNREPFRNSMLWEAIMELTGCYMPYFHMDKLAYECNVCLSIIEEHRYNKKCKEEIVPQYLTTFNRDDDNLDIEESRNRLIPLLKQGLKAKTPFDTLKWKLVADFMGVDESRKILWRDEVVHANAGEPVNTITLELADAITSKLKATINAVASNAIVKDESVDMDMYGSDGDDDDEMHVKKRKICL
jgi:hypothetical protein